ncbi:hypothetical protein [Micromonospora sp. NPDC000442]|uniref:hypothetical protein n=1 Tax=Micromonospora sp. NPDC000442 TaxID=3364217 RepID=UPI003676F66C
MTETLRVADMRSYLAATGWRLRPETWRGASLWDHPEGYGALVPAQDGMGDSKERSWELLQVLEKAEDRSVHEIAEDIRSPMVDTQSIRTFPHGQPSGFVSLTAGLRALEGIRSLFALAGRVEVEGRRFAYRGNHPTQVRDLLAVVQLGPTRPGSYIFTTRVPVEPPDPQTTMDGGDNLSRRSSIRLFHAIAAAQDATATVAQNGQLAVFDQAVVAGVSANLCEALSALGGTERAQPFEIGFRWARRLPVDAPAKTIAFGAHAGPVLRRAAKRLWRLDSSGQAHVTGVVESLHDDARTDDRWRVRVRGEVVTSAASEQRTVWLRLRPDSYALAVDAHLSRRIVRASGTIVPTSRRTEIYVDGDGFNFIS